MLTVLQAATDQRTRRRLRDAFLAAWHGVAPPGDIARTSRLTRPLGTLHHAVSHRSITGHLASPVQRHMRQSTARRLRGALAALDDPDPSRVSVTG